MEIENTLLSEITRPIKMNMVWTHLLVDSNHKHRTLSLQFVILETLNNKVNLKKNIYLSSWILEVEKIIGQKLAAQG